MPKIPTPASPALWYTFRDLVLWEANITKLVLDYSAHTTQDLAMRYHYFDEIHHQRINDGKARGQTFVRGRNVKTELMRHETHDMPYIPQYIFTPKDERIYAERQHVKAASLYGYQDVEDRIAQIPAINNRFIKQLKALTKDCVTAD